MALPHYVEIIGSNYFSNVIRISADKEVSVVSANSKSYSTEITLLYPLGSLGYEYYIVTPSTGPEGAFPEFSVITSKGPNVVDIDLTVQATFGGKLYPAKSKLTVTLNAYHGAQVQAKGDLSGTRIVSKEPVAVLSGHVCSWKYTKCNHVCEQLQPVNNWGKTFLVPPLPWQTKQDLLYIVASQSTVVNYQIGENKQTATLQAGQVLQVQVLPKNSVYVSAKAPIQAVFYSTGAVTRRFSYDTLLMVIPDIEKYSRVYSVTGQLGFQDFVFLVVKTSETRGVTVDGVPLNRLLWQIIPSTDYSWSVHELPPRILPYTIAHRDSSFGLLSVGIASMNSYGTPGTSVEGEEMAPLLVSYLGIGGGGGVGRHWKEALSSHGWC